METSEGVDRLRNEEVLRRIEGKQMLGTMRERKTNRIGHYMRRDCPMRG